MGPLLLLIGAVAALEAQQVADTAFRPPIENPAYPVGKGPVVLIDEAHFNFHTATGRYLAFAELLRRDGYVVQGSAGRFTAKTLKSGRVLVIIDQVATFTGSSFQVDAPGQPLLVFGPEVYSFARQNDPNPAPMKGHLQGAVLPFGKGRVAVFGEAAMFSAQLSGPNKNPMGMNAEIAKQNPQFLLNVMRWLTGLP